MICSTAVAVFLYVCSVEAAGEENYVFYFRRTELYDTNILLKMLQGVDREVESLCRKMEVNCRFTKAAKEYESLQTEAQGCAAPQDRQTLEAAKSSFDIAREECVNNADCKSGLALAIDKAVTSIENIDTAAYKAVTACGTDNLCKYSVYNNTHSNIFKLYLASRPQLHLLAYQGVASLGCAGAIVNCMVTRNEAALRRMYEGTESLRECLEGNQPVTVPDATMYSVRPDRKGWFEE